MRPSVYTPALIEKAREYLTTYQELGDAVPTVAGLACAIGVVRDTCYQWASEPEKAEFSDILKELAQRQERELVNKGLQGDFNAPITKMMLTKHGYSDKVENDHTSSDGTMTPKTAVTLTMTPEQAAEAYAAQINPETE